MGNTSSPLTILAAMVTGVIIGCYVSAFIVSREALDVRAGVRSGSASMPTRRKMVPAGSEVLETAPIADALGGEDGKAVFFVDRDTKGYTVLRDLSHKSNTHVGFVYNDAKTGGVIIEFNEFRVGVK